MTATERLTNERLIDWLERPDFHLGAADRSLIAHRIRALADAQARLARLERLYDALASVRKGLEVGDDISTAWSEWPETRDLHAVAEALRALSGGAA